MSNNTIKKIEIILLNNNDYVKGHIYLDTNLMVSYNRLTLRLPIDWYSSSFSITYEKIPRLAFIKMVKSCFTLKDKNGIRAIFFVDNYQDESTIKQFLTVQYNKAREEYKKQIEAECKRQEALEQEKADIEKAIIDAEKKRLKEENAIALEKQKRILLEEQNYTATQKRIEAERRQNSKAERDKVLREQSNIASRNSMIENLRKQLEEEMQQKKELAQIEAERKRQEELARIEAERKRQEELARIEVKEKFNTSSKEAKINMQKNWKAEYLQYVTEKAPQIASDIYLAMAQVEQHAIKTGVFPCSFYEMLSPDTVKIINAKITNNAHFNIQNRSIIRFIKDGLSLLSDFIDINICSASTTTNTLNSPTKIDSKVSINPFNEQTSFDLTAVEKIEDVSLSNPDKFCIFNKTNTVSSWVSLYLNFLSEINYHIPNSLDDYYKDQLLSGLKLLAKAGTIGSLKKPVQIANSIYYAETHIKAIDILKIIKKLCDKYNIKCSDVYVNYIGSIKYISNETKCNISDSLQSKSKTPQAVTTTQTENKQAYKPTIELIKKSLVDRERCFSKWLATNKNLETFKANEIVNNAKYIERLAIRANLPSYKVLCTYHSETVEKTRNDVISSTHYLIKDEHKTEGLNAIELYIEFLNEAFFNNKANSDNNYSNVIEPEGLLINFDNLSSLEFSKPLSFILYNEKYDNLKSWSDLYVKIMKVFAIRFPDFIKSGVKLSGGTSLDIGNDSCYYSMRSPRKITNKLYLETNLESNRIVNKIKGFMDLCSIDYSNLKIYYSKKTDSIANDTSTSVEILKDNQYNNHTTERKLDYKKLKDMSKYSLKDRKKALAMWLEIEKALDKTQVEKELENLNLLDKLVFKARLKHNDILWTSDIELVRATKCDILESTNPILIFDSKDEAMKSLDLYIEFLEVIFSISVEKRAETTKSESSTNSEIVYSKANESQVHQSAYVEKPTENQISKEDKPSPDTDTLFLNWMIFHSDLPEKSAKNYLSNLHAVEKMAKLQHFPYSKIISTLDYSEAFKTYTLLKANSLFVTTDSKANNQYSAAINSYLQFLADLPNNSKYDTAVAEKNGAINQDTITNIKTESKVDNTTVNADPKILSYQNVLRQKFKKGFRLSSALDLRKFKALYEEIEGKSLTEDDETIKKNISKCGIEYDEKLYLIESLLSEEIQQKLFAYIEKTFSSGKNALYYDALFEEFKEDFSCERIFDSEMLMLYLKETLKGKYHYSRTYISQEMFVRVEFDKEIKNCLMEHGTPVLTDIICGELSHIPQEKIRQVLSNNGEFIRNSKGEYFHCSLINFSDSDLNNISALIENAIDEKEYISGNELYDAIQKKYPHIIDNNAVLSPLGLRGAIAYSLYGRFSFDNNVISRYGEFLSMGDIYADFSKSRDRFSIDELRLLKNEINSGNIYFEAVYANSLRISQDTFVSRSNACFNVASTDSAIDMFMNGKDYMPLKDISSFGSFPYAGFPWNIYLLEHYVAEFSDKFKLIHNTYNEGNCVGAIVRKDSNINSFDELAAISLAESGTTLTENKALEFLCNSGYLAVRRYKGTAQAIIKAIEIRNKKGKN